MKEKTEFKINLISDADFELFKKLIYETAGIYLQEVKKTLVTNRLRKRLSELNIDNFYKYYQLCKKDIKEKARCVEVLTTNETYFYREPKHWEFLENIFLKEVEEKFKNKNFKQIKIWSCACSTGEEPYTIAIILKEKLNNFNEWNIKILATDINEKVLETAKQGIYPFNRIEKSPKYFIQKYFKKEEDKYFIIDDIKKMAQFKKHNILEPLPFEKFDCIFCRNVLIYFDTASKKKVLMNLKSNLKPDGYLCLGHSEGIAFADTGYKFVRPAVYKI